MTIIPYEIAKELYNYDYNRPLDVKWTSVPNPPDRSRPFVVQCYCTWGELNKIPMITINIEFDEWKDAEWWFGQCPACDTIFWTYSQKKT